MPATRKTRTPSVVYQIKVALRGSSPPIWRRLLVPGEATLRTLHWIVQAAMGWDNSHLHQFRVGDARYSDPDFEIEEVEDEGEYEIRELLPRLPARLVYEYDFGDGWEHEIRVEKVVPPVEGETYPVCVAGALACPPEDCGGIYGYYDFLEALRDPAHEEHESMLDWIGGEFDPAAFDLAGVNQALKSIR